MGVLRQVLGATARLTWKVLTENHVARCTIPKY